VLDDETLAKAFVVLVETERREIDIEENRFPERRAPEAERAQPAGEAIAAALEVAPHAFEIFVGLGEP